MSNVGQAATAELVGAAAAPAPGWLARSLGLAAVAIALLSALVTFVVLAGLTPIAPTHEVVVTLLACNAVTVLLLTCSSPGKYGAWFKQDGAAGQQRACTCALSPSSR